MKPLSLLFLAIGLIAIVAIGGGVYAISGSHSKSTQADQGSPTSSTDGASNSDANGNNGGGNGQRGQHMRQMFAQLGLTDAQKQQIDQIRQTVTDRQQRREQIMNVLTPEQRAKLEQLRAERRAHSDSTTSTSTTPAPSPAPTAP